MVKTKADQLRKPSVLPQNVLPQRPSLGNEDGDGSDISFKRWHIQMQARHQSQGGTGFRLWRCCYKGCECCRWFDSIPYDKKICKCCLTFKTFKAIGTFSLIALFCYTIMYTFLDNEILPGGTIFFLFFLGVTGYVTGYIVLFVGLQPMVGHLLVGMVCGNVPNTWLPSHDPEKLERIGMEIERIVLVMAVIRAGLLLDLSRIKDSLIFVIELSTIPSLIECITVFLTSFFLLQLPWEWCAILGSVLCMVSLATITSVMEKLRLTGYGEEKNLSTVLIAACALDMVFGTILYVTFQSYIFPSYWHKDIQSSAGKMIANVVEQILMGIASGLIFGFLISFFPDKRNVEAAIVRIVVLGLASFSLVLIFWKYNLLAAGVLAVITVCVITRNMWEEMGWHDRNNPVQYFYTMVYYIGSPLALSLVGYSLNFKTASAFDVGMSIAVIVIGITLRELTCYFVTLGNRFPLTGRERVFVCLAWFCKGTFQALLSYAIEVFIEHNKDIVDLEVYTQLKRYGNIIKLTVILSVLLTTPLAGYGLIILGPRLLKQSERFAGATTVQDSGAGL